MDLGYILSSWSEHATFILSGIMTCNALLTFIMLIFVNAPYGRYSSSAWGPPVNAKTAWFLQELPSLGIPVTYIFVHWKEIPTINLLLMTLFCIHYTQRALIYPFLLRGGTPTPFVPFFLAFIFCAYNGTLQSLGLRTVQSYPNDWLGRPHVVFGIMLFICGMCINIHSDSILRNLRKPGEKGYKIPKGGVFEYVSGANFFGEMIEWIGFAIACSTFPAFSFALFTACNIGPRAYSHHRWYKEKFEDYPKTRKALIPFVL